MYMKVLFVDDETDLLEIAQGFFEDENIELVTSSDFHDALQKVKSDSFDAVISDNNMPSGNGRELLRLIKDELKFKGKLVLVTGDLQRNSESDACDLVVLKPINFIDFVDKIKSLIS